VGATEYRRGVTTKTVEKVNLLLRVGKDAIRRVASFNPEPPLEG
jgi:hypothetical protein